MAQVTEVRLVDDLDGGDADESVDFTVDNKRYQMDLSEKNAARLREILAPFIAAARRPNGATTTRTRRSTTAARPFQRGCGNRGHPGMGKRERIRGLHTRPDLRLCA
jgi:hypothetical protein